MLRRLTEPRCAWLLLCLLGLGAGVLAGCAQPLAKGLAEERFVSEERAARVQELQERLGALLCAQAAGEEALAQVEAARRELMGALETAQRRAREVEAALRTELADAQRLAMQRAATIKELESARANMEQEAARARDEVTRLQKQIAILQTTHRLELKKLTDRIRELEGGRQERQ